MTSFNLDYYTYSKAVEFDPSNDAFWYGKSNGLLQMGNPEDAMAAIEEAIRLNPGKVENLKQKMMILVQLLEYEKAVELLKEIEKIEPKNVENLINRAKILINLNKYSECIDVLEKAELIEPENEEITILKSEAIMRDGNNFKQRLRELKKSAGSKDVEEIIEYLKKVDYENPAIMTNFGAALCELGQYREGIKALEKAIELDPGDSRPLYNKGLALRKIGNKKEALKIFEKVVELEPTESSLECKYKIEIDLELYEEALKTIEKAIELYPKSWQHWDNKSKVLFNLDRKDEAIDSFIKGERLKPLFGWLTKENISEFYGNVKAFLKSIQKKHRRKKMSHPSKKGNKKRPGRRRRIP